MDTTGRRFILLNAALAAAAVAALYLPQFALGDDYKPLPGEKAPREEIKCDWSKLSAAEYSECQKRKEYYKNLSPQEARQQNVEATKQRVINGVNSAEDRGWRHNARKGGR